MSDPIIRANNGQAFYCTVFEILDPSGETEKVDYEHCQATSTAMADFEFRRAHETDIIRRRVRVISTAPCVGGFINEETGEMTL
jgi:hypothetical protein